MTRTHAIARFHRISVERDGVTPSPSRDSITARLDHLMEEPKDHSRRMSDAYTHLAYYTHKLEPHRLDPSHISRTLAISYSHFVPISPPTHRLTLTDTLPHPHQSDSSSSPAFDVTKIYLRSLTYPHKHLSKNPNKGERPFARFATTLDHETDDQPSCVE